MPFLMMHYKAAYLVAQAGQFGDIQDLPAFYLGCLVPDAVNVRGFASRELRWRAHLREKDLKQWTQNVLLFYREEWGRRDPSYLFGYALHCLTDILWDEKYDPPLLRQLEGLGLTAEEAHRQSREEFYAFDTLPENQKWFSEKVLPHLRQARAEEIHGISPGEIERFAGQAEIKLTQLPKGICPRFVTEELVDRFAAELCQRAEIFL